MLNKKIMEVFDEIAEEARLSDNAIALLNDLLNDLADGKIDDASVNDKMHQIFNHLK